MSFAEVLSEIPHLTREQRQELLRRVIEADTAAPSASGSPFCAREIEGRVVLVGSRTIRQAEVDAILEELP